MIKLIRGGCYYMGGVLVKENQAFLTADKKEEARNCFFFFLYRV